ncbi:MAG: hypothetical protein AB4062_08065 [Crocosphaera sp.]
MICIGTLVRVIYPDYAKGVEGRVEAQESNGRWLIKLDQNPINHKQESIVLSLDESEFDVIQEEI